MTPVKREQFAFIVGFLFDLLQLLASGQAGYEANCEIENPRHVGDGIRGFKQTSSSIITERMRGMMAMVSFYDQMDLFPFATKQDIDMAKSLLSRYRRLKGIVDDFESIPPETDKQVAAYESARQCTRNVERAVNQIVDFDVRSVIEYRFLRGNSRAATILRFSGWDYCNKTIDRKITEGIESVANSLLYL